MGGGRVGMEMGGGRVGMETGSGEMETGSGEMETGSGEMETDCSTAGWRLDDMVDAEWPCLSPRDDLHVTDGECTDGLQRWPCCAAERAAYTAMMTQTRPYRRCTALETLDQT